MLQAMFSGVSGLQVHQTKLDVIGNNIANVNTVGFKAGAATFEDQLSQTLRDSAGPNLLAGGQNPTQVGLGVTLGSIDTLQTQGNLQTTGKSTDLAIQGSGYFVVSSGTNVAYTRDGSFDLDSDGVLVNPASGSKLLGYLADSNGVIDLSQNVTSTSILKVPVGSLASVKQSSTSNFEGNLDASSGLQSTVLGIKGQLDTSKAPPSMNSTVFDALGNPHAVVVTLSNPVHNPAAGAGVPTGATQRWDTTITVDGVSQIPQKLYAIPVAGGGSSFVFTDMASPANPLGSTATLNVTGSNGAASFPVSVDFASLQAQSNVSIGANGQAGANPIQSTLLNMTGNLNLDGGSPITNTATIYDASGQPYTIQTTLSNPTIPAAGANVPPGALQQWDVKVDITPPGGPAFTAYDSSAAGNLESKAYYVPGTGFVTADGVNPANSLGGTIQLVAGALPPGSFNQGLQPATGFPLTIDLSGLSTTKVNGVNDGLSGKPPVWNTTLNVYDSLGVTHTVSFKFTRALVGSGAPATASGRWEWTASENGNPIADSTSTGNSALFFDSDGALINTGKQTFSINPPGGASPLSVSADFSKLTQVAGTSTVAAITQNGFPVGTLQSFQISQDGLITGIFTNGQTRTLGQIATANFSNPSGLEKLGQNQYKESSNSGLAQIGLPDQSGRGKISTGFVEMSNVDLSAEFTNLIITQRGFQANTKIITVVDELLQVVIDLKR